MTGHGSLAPNVQQVRVLSVDAANNAAVVRTTLGKEMTVTTLWQRTAMLPKAGERWLIDQSLGRWSFAARVGASAPGLQVVNPMIGQTFVQTVSWAYPGGDAQVTFTDPVIVSQEGPYFHWDSDTGLGPVAKPGANGLGVSTIGIVFPGAGHRFWILADNGEDYYGESISNWNWYRIPIYAVVTEGSQMVPWVWHLWCDTAVTVQVYQSFGMVLTDNPLA